MNARSVREYLGKAKTASKRGELTRALNFMISAFKSLEGQQAPSDLRGDFRDALTDLNADPEFKKLVGAPVAYQAGQERALLNLFIRLSNSLLGLEEQEEYEVALQRKLNLDRCLKDGKKFLQEGKISEAEQSFTDAYKFYKNESGLFALIAKAFMDAGEYVRALGHLRQGLKTNPNDEGLRRLAEECARLRS
jgi:tetratricopeptide (TPR) repeat protein